MFELLILRLLARINLDRTCRTVNLQQEPRDIVTQNYSLVYQQSLVRGALYADCVEQDIQRARGKPGSWYTRFTYPGGMEG